MKNKKETFKYVVERNRLRRLISNVNWRYHRQDLIQRLKAVVDGFNKNELLLTVHENSIITKPFVEGNDSFAIRFFIQSTNIIYHTDEYQEFDYETGAALVFSHSDVGFDTVFLYPATSKQSGADYKKLIVYHNLHGAKFNDRTVNKLIKCLCLYHRYTSVLFESTPLLRLQISLLRFRSFLYEYLDSEHKLKYSSGIYIPLVSLFVSAVALIVAVIALK
ncbi:hypothetical protein [Enterobacter hormaechei]|uniref:hypothetical protein n=1 Tax=Enterobacter hormaechei TaxID=158836 RepID=UPI00335EB951